MNGIRTALAVNGAAYVLQAPAYRTLLDALRDGLALKGTKKGCDAGECGSCNVLVDGIVVRACLTLLADVAGADIRTIEGLGEGPMPSCVQQAFIDAGAIQCGFCMPGMIVAATALLAADPAPTVDDVRAGLAGTLCRCSGYVKVIDAVLLAARRRMDRAA
jgi:carbon-monoxide dehydrogenase small subunit